MLIQLQQLGKSFGETVILHNVELSVEAGERIGIVGQNGTGKTTLLRTICGEYQPDEGSIAFGDGAVLGYLAQNSQLDPTRDVYQEMKTVYAPCLEAMAEMTILEHKLEREPEQPELLHRHAELSAIIDAMDGYHMDVEIKKVLSGMDFPPQTYEKKVSVLSGGEYTRLRLAKLLLQKPDILVLDEPTNHLDFTTMEWLEGYLKGYKGAVLVVSHDRYFLDAVATRIWEVENQQVTSYKGNYSAYLPQKEMAVEYQQKQHDADVAKAAKLQDYIDRNLVRASTTKMAQSRRKQLEKMEITEAPQTNITAMEFRFEFDITPYNELITLKDLSIRLGNRVLLEPLSLQIFRGDRLVIAGPNGAGKSTLMQVLDGKRRPSGGMVRLGAGARYSIFEQQFHRSEGRVIDAIWNRYPRFTELEVRSHLARFAFRGEDVFQPCVNLSGGELARLRFAEMVLERPNLLFLDEPTNHLDIFARESLTQALTAYEGTLVLITHDRYLMEQLGCPILYIDQGKATLFESYEKMMGRDTAPPVAGNAQVKEPPKAGGGYGKEQRRRRAEVRSRLKTIEQEIEEWSAHVVELENELNDPEIVRDHIKLRDKCDELEDARFHQDELFEEWEKLLEEQEQMENEE